jgi:hypothetical protein
MMQNRTPSVGNFHRRRALRASSKEESALRALDQETALTEINGTVTDRQNLAVIAGRRRRVLNVRLDVRTTSNARSRLHAIMSVRYAFPHPHQIFRI